MRGNDFLCCVRQHAFGKNGIKAAALTGAQAGFLTDNNHTNAKILEMKPERLVSMLADHDAVVIARLPRRDCKRGISQRSAAAEAIHRPLRLARLWTRNLSIFIQMSKAS